MPSAHKEYLDKAQDRISGAKVSQLAMAAPLESSSSSSSAKPKPTETQKPVQIVNQKAGMVKALLAVGALRPAIAILTKFPWLVDAHTDIADLLLRIVKESISTLYDTTCVLRERNPSFTQPRVRYAGSRPAAAPQRRTFLTLWAPTPPSTMYTDFVFFFPDWRQFVPICSSLDDLVDIVDPLLRFVGLHISREPLFVTKFLRLGRAHLITTVQSLLPCICSTPNCLCSWKSTRRPRSQHASLTPVIPSANSGSRLRVCISYRPFLSSGATLFVLSKSGTSSSNTKLSLGGDCMANGRPPSINHIPSYVCAKFRLIGRRRGFFDASHTIPSTHCLERSRNLHTQTRSFSSIMLLGK